MTYRDFSNRQITKIRRDCHNAMQIFAKTQAGHNVDPIAWQAAWSKAFIAGVNALEHKYKNLGLFDASLDTSTTR